MSLLLPKYAYSGSPLLAAAQRALARLMPRRVFAPRRDLFSVPSMVSMMSSISFWWVTSFPISFFAMSELILCTAMSTFLPW